MLVHHVVKISSRRFGKQDTHIIGRMLLLSVIALILAVANSVEMDGSFSSLSSIAVKGIAFFIILMLGLKLFRLLVERERFNPSGRIDRVSSYLFISPYSILRCVIVLISCWIIYIICLYPGVLCFDTSFQLVQFYGNPSPGIFPMQSGCLLTDHHPILTTFLFGLVLSIGKAIFLTYENGFFFLCIAQLVVLSIGLSILLQKLYRVGVSKNALLCLLAFFGLFPCIPIVMMSPSKDTIFVCILIFYLIEIIDVFKEQKESGSDNLLTRREFIKLVLLVLAMSLSKKTAGLIAILVAIIVLYRYRKFAIGFSLSHFIGVFFALIIIPLGFPLFSISPGSKIETLAPLYQQTARYVREHPSDVSAAEEDVIDNMIGFDGLADRYDYKLSDNVVHYWAEVNQWPTNEEILAYIKVWLAQGLRHPDSYIKAFVAQESGWFDVDQSVLFTAGSGDLLVTPANGIPSISRPSFFRALSDWAISFASWISGIPGIDILFTPVLYTLIIPILVMCGCRTEKTGSYYAVCFVWIASLLFLVISPTSMTATNFEAVRYCFPFFFISPILLTMTVGL